MSADPLARILIVDDDEASMRALCDTLRNHGYETTGAGSGEDALKLLPSSSFDLLLTDLMMPGMDGVALLTESLKIDPYLVGILMTGAGTIETAVKAMKAGALDYVLKPIQIAAILPVLSRAIDMRRLRLENMELRDTVAVHELSQAIAHTLEPNILLDKIADAALAQFDADEVSIMLAVDDGSALRVAAVRGERRDALLGVQLPIGEGIAGWAASRREPLILQGEITDPTLRPPFPRADIQSALSMPMISRNKLVGVLNVACTRKRGAFSLGQVKILSIFTNAAAAGIEAARLYNDQRMADARYRDVLQIAADGIIAVDSEQRIEVFNTRAEQLFGYRAEEVIGRPLDILLPDGSIDAHRNHVKAFGEGLSRSRTMAGRGGLHCRRKDGTLFKAEIGISSRQEDGSTHYTAIVCDITERMRSEEKLSRLMRIRAVMSAISSVLVRSHDRQELFREACRVAVEEGGFGIAWIGVLDPATLAVNSAACAGVESGSYMAMASNTADGNVPLGRGFVGQAIREKRVVYCNNLLDTPTAGGVRRQEAVRRGYRSLIVLPLVVDGKVAGNLSLFARQENYFDSEELELLNQLAANISFGLEHIARAEELEIANAALAQEHELLARRVAERTEALTQTNEHLRKAQEDAEQANRAKSAFLAAMSHEIRTPMNGVLGMVEVLLHDGLSERQIDLLATIRESATSLLGIIDDILDFSKIEAGRLDIARESVAVSDLVEGICSSLLPVAARYGVDIALFVSPELPEILLTDETRLRQVIYNLLGNAIKFSGGRREKRGRVAIRVEIAQRDPLRVVFRVLDNGIGMSPETVSNLFAPFTQGETSTTRRFGGTGLGLAICKRLVDLMHGEIAAQSTLGMGSTFAATLPLEAPTEQPVSSLPDLSGLDCVLVESPDLDADDLALYLEHAGAGVHMVSRLAEATEATARLAPPVVLIQDAGRDRVSRQAQFAAMAASPNAGHLLMTWGQRRRCRVEALEVVTLDRDALRRRSFLRAVLVAAGRAPPDVVPARSGKPVAAEVAAAPPSIVEARAQGRLILVAEDDVINQKVILQQLALLGYAAEITSTGMEALEMWRRGGFALLLTDLHMPDMDGYALTEAIRRYEAGQRRMPIVALTANALRGEANRARAVGMDDYLTKPIALQALQAALARCMPAPISAAPVAQQNETDGREECRLLDVSVLKALVGDNPDTVREFLCEYLKSAREQAVQLRAALSLGEPSTVSAVAHKLKSSSRSVGALALGDVCAELDGAGRAGQAARITQLAPKFEALFAEVEEELARLLLERR